MQEPGLSQRKSTPKWGLVLIFSVCASGFALLLFVFVRKAFRSLSEDPNSAAKLNLIKSHILAVDIFDVCVKA